MNKIKCTKCENDIDYSFKDVKNSSCIIIKFEKCSNCEYLLKLKDVENLKETLEVLI